MDIAYISWNYGKSRGDITTGPVTLHLIRLKDGRGLLRTSAEMVKLGLATWD